jgi:hypothetical protein
VAYTYGKKEQRELRKSIKRTRKATTKAFNAENQLLASRDLARKPATVAAGSIAGLTADEYRYAKQLLKSASASGQQMAERFLVTKGVSAKTVAEIVLGGAR